MFLFFPLIFFTLFFISSYKRKGVDLGSFMILMYVITSFFAVVLHYSSPDKTLDDYTSFSISFTPTIVYCSLIGICLYPYFRLNTNKKRFFLRIKNIRLFNYITYFYFIVFVFLILFLYNDIFDGILKSNMADLRNDAENDDLSNSLTTLGNPVLRLIGFLMATIGYGAGFMIPFFFYSICFTNNSVFHSVIILISSLSSIIMGIIAIDRSCVILWTLMFFLSYFLYKPYMTAHNKSFINKIFFAVGGILGVYFITLTVSRFLLTDMGTGGSLLSYVGQPFLNFCNIWDNIEVRDISTQCIFPATNRFILGTDPEAHQLINISGHYVRTNGFVSFIGIFYKGMGKLLSVIVPLTIAFFSYRRVIRVQKKASITFKDIMHVFLLGIIVLYGSISYYYNSHESTIDLCIMLFLLSLFKFEKVKNT